MLLLLGSFIVWTAARGRFAVYYDLATKPRAPMDTAPVGDKVGTATTKAKVSP